MNAIEKSQERIHRMKKSNLIIILKKNISQIDNFFKNYKI